MNPALTHGAFSWAELMTSDPAAAATFYGKVLGWSTQIMPMPELGDYRVQMNGETPVAGIMALPHEPMPSAWVYYVTVKNVDEVLANAESRGAKVIVPAVDVPTVGRLGGFTDPQGAYVSVITYEPMAEDADQPVPDFAATFVTPGAFSWFQLQSTDVAAACEFYKALFGWEIVVDMMGMGPYHIVKVNGVGIGGIIPVMQEGIPPHWGAYVTVDDTDKIASAAASSGGAVVVPPMDLPKVGRFSLIQDPTGGMINVIKYVPMEQPA